MLPLILGLAGGSFLGGALGNTKAAKTSTVTPTLDPQYKTLSDLLRQRSEERLRSSMNMGGYEAQGIQNVNDAYQGAGQNLNASLTARGLASSPVAGNAQAAFQTSRAGDIARFLNTIPQVQRQMQAEDIGLGQNLIAQNMGQQQIGAGTPLSGGINSLAGMIGYLMGQGVIGGAGGTK